MAATDAVLDNVVEVTLAVADRMYQVDFPLNARSYTVYSVTNASKLIEAGGTDVTAIGEVKSMPLAANTEIERQVPGVRGGRTRNMNAATRRIWLASTEAGTVVKVLAHTHPANP